MWGIRGHMTNKSASQILTGNDMGWKLVTLDENKHSGLAPPICQTILRTASFRLIMMGVILTNGLVTATMYFKHDERPRHVFYEKYYYIEVAFTIFLDLEALFKIWCLGFRGYFKHSYHKFELLLTIGTTLHIIPTLYLSGLTYFQIFEESQMVFSKISA
ncbi:sodium leak channel NALCN-like isoform X3 [Lycorma delicatula]|uniref:sodium leak channel NALCN-like isoform X3 n=1 Tax=Lycorma delicatula TaxID=130591 RepID=UPI003F516D68